MTGGLFYSIVLYPILFILPAWIANGTPVLFGGGTPLDFNRKIGGRSILGKHKTLRGTISGLLGGFIIAGLESAYFPGLLATGFALTVGAILGDLLGSFIKRRLSLKEGANVLLMDQYLFFVAALVVALPSGNFPAYPGLVFITLLTGPLHLLSNMAAHRAKLKQVPW